ncbi:MAG: hypothetical protein ACR2M1_11350 [Gemmatimonadaceae bacterium]
MRASNNARTAIIYTPTALQVESWRLLWEELARDPWSIAEYWEWEDRRRRAQPQILELLGRFLSGAADAEDLRATFDARTRTDWDLFGLRGASGAMFLNNLVKYVADAAALSVRLRVALVAPESREDGRAKLRDLVSFLSDAEALDTSADRHIQPARAVFFITTWWHLQDERRWPDFQLSARTALQLEEGLYAPTGNAVEDYLSFRETYLALAAALGISTWQLDYLCWWHQQRDRQDETVSGYGPERLSGPTAVPSAVRESRARPRIEAPLAPVREQRAGPKPRSSVDHTQLQWLLAHIGKRLGCRVWIAANDRTKPWNGESLASLSIDRLPSLGLDPDTQRVISLIDVVWLRGSKQVAAAFEVERTTAVYSGLLRLADLAASAPNLNFPVYIVAPEARLAKVRRELSRPTFRILELDRRCAFFSGEALIDSAENMMRWGNGPNVIERIARRVDQTERADPVAPPRQPGRYER